MSGILLASIQAQPGSAVRPLNQTISIASTVAGLPTSSPPTLPSSGRAVPVPSVLTSTQPSLVSTSSIATSFNTTERDPSSVTATAVAPASSDSLDSPSVSSISKATGPVPPVPTSSSPTKKPEIPSPSTTSASEAPASSISTSRTASAGEPPGSSSSNTAVTSTDSAPRITSTFFTTPGHTEPAQPLPSSSDDTLSTTARSPTPGAPQDSSVPSPPTPTSGSQTIAPAMSTGNTESNLAQLAADKGHGDNSNDNDNGKNASSASSVASTSASGFSHSVTAKDPVTASPPPEATSKVTSNSSASSASPPPSSVSRSASGTPQSSVSKSAFSATPSIPGTTASADPSPSPDVSNNGALAPNADGQLTDTMSTSTVVEHPESTFARPVSIPVVVSGHTTVTAPPFITSLATSTEPGGSSVTVITHVIANPTSGLNQALASHSFFNNHGAVAGVFLVVGIVVAFICGVLLWLCCRRRSQRRAAMLEDHSPTLPDQDPFADPVEEARMSMIAERRSGIDWDRLHLSRNEPMPNVVDLPSPAHSSSHARAALTSVAAGHDAARQSTVYPYLYEDYEGPFSGYHEAVRRAAPLLTGVPFPSFAFERSPAQAHSRARSTPSLYPPSVPDDTTDSLFEKEMQPPPAVICSTFERDIPQMPLEPVRRVESPRQQPQPYHFTTTMDYEPIPPTPAMSISSHTQSSHLESPTTPAASDNGLGSNENGHYRLNFAGTKTAPGAFLRRNYSKRNVINTNQIADDVSA